MLTTKQILKNTAKELNLPYEEVEIYYYAWIKGIEERLEKEEVITFKIKGVGYFNFSVPSNSLQNKDTGKGERNKNRVKKFRARKAKARQTYRDSLEERPDMTPLEKKMNYYRNKHFSKCPIHFYGYSKGYDIFEIDKLQREFYNQTNKK